MRVQIAVHTTGTSLGGMCSPCTRHPQGGPKDNQSNLRIRGATAEYWLLCAVFNASLGRTKLLRKQCSSRRRLRRPNQAPASVDWSSGSTGEHGAQLRGFSNADGHSNPGTLTKGRQARYWRRVLW